MKNQEAGSLNKTWIISILLAGAAAFAMPAGTVWAENEPVPAAAEGEVMDHPAMIIRRLHQLTQEKKYTDIVALATEAVRRYPEEPVFYAARCNAYVQLDQLENGAADASAVIRLRPEENLHYVIRGMLYGDMGKYEAAISDYETARKLAGRENSSGVSLQVINEMEMGDLYRYGKNALANGDTEKAIALSGRMLAIDPDSAKAHALKEEAEKKLEGAGNV